VVVIGVEIGAARPFRGKLTPRLTAAVDHVLRLIEFEIASPLEPGAPQAWESEQETRFRTVCDQRQDGGWRPGERP
jgi:hypothetical protein